MAHRGFFSNLLDRRKHNLRADLTIRPYTDRLTYTHSGGSYAMPAWSIEDLHTNLQRMVEDLNKNSANPDYFFDHVARRITIDDRGRYIAGLEDARWVRIGPKDGSSRWVLVKDEVAVAEVLGPHRSGTGWRHRVL